jgi:hypothetical protein
MEDNMSLQPHEKTVLNVIREADGRIQLQEIASRVKDKMFPGSARTAGIFTMLEKALKTLVGEKLIATDEVGVFYVTKAGREA